MFTNMLACAEEWLTPFFLSIPALVSFFLLCANGQQTRGDFFIVPMLIGGKKKKAPQVAELIIRVGGGPLMKAPGRSVDDV